MKKALAFLLAFALVGAFVFAQDEAPAANGLVDLFTKAPVVTYGADGGLDYMFDGSMTKHSWDTNGYDSISALLNTNSVYFYSAPWVKFAYGNLSFMAKYYWDPIGYDSLPYIGTISGTGGAITDLIQFTTKYTFDKLTYTNNVYWDINNGLGNGSPILFNTHGLSLSADNVSATFGVMTAWDGAFVWLNFNTWIVTDASFTIKNVFDVATIKLGGSGSNYVRIMSLFGGSPYYNLFVTQGTIGRMRERVSGPWLGLGDLIAMSNAYLPMLETITLKDKLSLPLTVYFANPIPYAGTSMPDYLNSKKMTVAAKYDLEGIGSIDLGWNIGLGYDIGLKQTAGLWTKNERKMDGNTFFFDAKINMEALSALTVLFGVDFYLGQFESTDGITGTGTLVDPTIKNYVAENKFILGLEAQYDFADMIEGLSIDFALYIKNGAGKTYDNQNAGAQTFAQYLDAIYPTAAWFRMASMTEANYIQKTIYGFNPMRFMLQVNYALNDTFSFYLRDLYDGLAGTFDAASTTFASAATPPVGYYDTNKIVLNTDIVQGAATISFAFSYTMALGMPTAANLGYTDAIAQAAATPYATAADIYRAEAPSIVTNPWGLNIMYMVSF